MASPVDKTDHLGSVPATAISCPDNGDKVIAEYHRAAVAALLANDDAQQTNITSLGNTKVAKAGDTMTGKLTISPSTAVQGLQVSAGAASDQNAIQATGNGLGPAIIGTGGSNGAGASFTAGGGNNFGGRGIGAGNEVGWEGQGGSSGSGMRARPGTAATTTAPTYAYIAQNGGLHMDGVVSPNANVDPGVDFAQFPQSMVTSSAIVESDGAGNFTVRNNKGLNVNAFAGTALGVATVTFKRNLPGTDYRMMVYPPDGYLVGWNGVQNVGNYQFVVRNAATNAVVDLTATALAFSVSTVGF